jgi:hypothetical protein
MAIYGQDYGRDIIPDVMPDDDSGNFNNFPGGFAGGDGEHVFDPSYGGSMLVGMGGTAENGYMSPGGNGRSDLTNTINGIFGSNLSGADLAARAATLGGGLAGGLGLLAPKVQKVGYQGGIPKYTAERSMVTAPPTKAQGYRPGQGGVNYGGNVTYTPIPGSSSGGSSGDSGGGSSGGSGLGNIAKVAAGVGGAGLLANYLGGAGGIGNLISGITGGMTGGPRPGTPTFSSRPATPPGGARPGTPAAGGGSRGMGGGGGGGGGGSGPNGELSTPEGEYAGADEFTGIDEQINANENDLASPSLSEEDIQAEFDRIYGEMPNYYDDAPYMPTYDDYYDYGSGDDYVFDLSDPGYAKGGSINMAKGRYLQGETDGMADKIPAKIGRDQPAALSHGEFVVPADIVSHLGNGNSDAGAKKLYTMMDRIREARTGTKKQGKKINPDKFMPGGLAQAYSNGGSVKRYAVGGTLPAGSTGSEQAPNSFAGEYIADMMGKGQALANAPYQQYMGPLTAGASDLQNKVYGGLQNTNFPGNLGTSFSSAGAPSVPTMGSTNNQPVGAGQPAGGAQQPQGIASQYMNPYLQNVLNPQMEELRRQAQINNMSGLGALTKSGAFGGGRQAIMESEAGRNLLQEQNKALGQGYASAFDRAQQQFNTEQTQGMGLANLMSTQGAQQRGIEAEGIAADKAAFEEARENPYKMVQYQQSLLQGMPISATNYSMPQQDALTRAAGGATTVNALLNTLGLGTPTATPPAAPKK